ncbi:MAG: sigma-70 family RNA polymerase sigma factor [Deltaproteobacteria bacterium]|nr:sigma-70 family RNA polymerase sigma factor [Deltaproteobacteria bacterium]
MTKQSIDNRERIRSAELVKLYPKLLQHASRWAVVCSLGGSKEPADLVQQAVASLLGGAAWPEGVTLEHWLYVRVRQLATTQRRHERRFPSIGLEPLEMLVVPSRADQRDVVKRVEEWLRTNLSEEEQVIVSLWADGVRAPEMRETFELSVREYRQMRIKVRRSLARMPPELWAAVKEFL